MSDYTSMMKIWDLSLPSDNALAPDFYNAVIVTEGYITAAVGGEILNLPQNHILLLSPDTVNFIGGSGSCLILSFKGEGEILDKIKSKAFYLDDDNLNLINRAKASDEELKLYQYDLILRLLLTYCYEAENVNLPSGRKDAAIFAKAVSVLEDNIASDISVGELAEKLGVSLSLVKRLFAKYSYLGAHEYLIALKIIKAKELLRQNVSVTETAELVGFATQAYFSAAFKKITGVSPKAYFGNNTEKEIIKPKTKPQKAPQQKKESLPSYLL